MSFAARLRLLLALGALLLGVLLLLRMGVYGRPDCYWWQFSGTYCPACGGERALFHLKTGQWMDALRSNAMVVLAIPLGLLWLYEGYSGRRWFGRRAWWMLIGGVLIYSVLRNLPGLEFLQPQTL